MWYNVTNFQNVTIFLYKNARVFFQLNYHWKMQLQIIICGLNVNHLTYYLTKMQANVTDSAKLVVHLIIEWSMIPRGNILFQLEFVFFNIHKQIMAKACYSLNK
jgi:hypothetical protein